MHCPSHIQSGVHGRSAFSHFHILLKLFLQPQWTSSLQMTAAASSVTHCGCSCSFLPRVQPQFGGSGRTGLRAVACPHMYLPWYTARFTFCSRASRVGGSPSNPLPFLANKYFRALLTWNKYQIVTINKCKRYTSTSSQEETDFFSKLTPTLLKWLVLS